MPTAVALPKHLQQRYEQIFEHNQAWAAAQNERDPDFYKKLVQGQTPDYLWIGCSDARVPAELVTGLLPGEAFVHRNVANVASNVDLSMMSVIDYAIRHLKVRHIIVCGHYGCGGVQASMNSKDLGVLNPWIRNIKDVYRLHESELDAISNNKERYDRLVELNVMEQCRNIIKTDAFQESYAANDFPVVSGWVFKLHDGLIKDLKIDFRAMLEDSHKIYSITK
ncbi:hypothetical protein OIDMADRAFT_160573 [Oidiodendron maius Zn]|uniref:Carbonic anhydrase n=1 Tax=Oidiodendron maius (strain Zn) TaxID=913774 RepID=A0A0C3HKY9_OIDMZ|nr:hypothetical protein OIDMADRAFT_160573 [Oidiodendron maius Zn]